MLPFLVTLSLHLGLMHECLWTWVSAGEGLAWGSALPLALLGAWQPIIRPASVSYSLRVSCRTRELTWPSVAEVQLGPTLTVPP